MVRWLRMERRPCDVLAGRFGGSGRSVARVGCLPVGSVGPSMARLTERGPSMAHSGNTPPVRRPGGSVFGGTKRWSAVWGTAPETGWLAQVNNVGREIRGTPAPRCRECHAPPSRRSKPDATRPGQARPGRAGRRSPVAGRRSPVAGRCALDPLSSPRPGQRRARKLGSHHTKPATTQVEHLAAPPALPTTRPNQGAGAACVWGVAGAGHGWPALGESGHGWPDRTGQQAPHTRAAPSEARASAARMERGSG